MDLKRYRNKAEMEEHKKEASDQQLSNVTYSVCPDNFYSHILY